MDEDSGPVREEEQQLSSSESSRESSSDGGGHKSPSLPPPPPSAAQNSSMTLWAALSAPASASTGVFTSAAASASDARPPKRPRTALTASLSDALALGQRTELLVTLAGSESGGTGGEVSAATLPLLLAAASSGGPFSTDSLFHALRMLGEAAMTPAPPGDPERTWLTMFSRRWYPCLHCASPHELRAIQAAAAYMGVPREESDSVIGAVCAQRWANVPPDQLAVLGLHWAVDDEDGISDDGYEHNFAADIASLYEEARKRFALALAPFSKHVAPRILDLARWTGSHWPGVNECLGEGETEGYTPFKYGRGLKFGCEFRGRFERGSNWVGDDTFLVDDRRMYVTLEECSDYEHALRTELEELTAEMEMEGSTSLSRFEALNHDIAVIAPYLRSRVTSMLALAAAALAPAAECARPPPVKEEGKVRPKGWEDYNLCDNLEHAFEHRMRGVPICQAWTKMDEVGAALAALSGFREDGEAGSLAAVTQWSTPRATLGLFAAAGSVPALKWAFAAGLVDAEGRAPPGKWSRIHYHDPVLELMENEAVAGGHVRAVKFIVAHKTVHRLSDANASLALREGHMGMLDSNFDVDTLAAEAAGGDALSAVLSHWAELIEGATGVSSSDLLGGGAARPLKDEALTQWALERALPLGVETVHRLARAGSLGALKLLYRKRCLTVNPTLAANATHSGAPILQWLRSLKPPVEYDAAILTAAVKRLQRLMRPRSTHPPGELSANAFDAIQHLLKERCPLGDATVQRSLCASAVACHGYALLVLRALREAGCVWDERGVLMSPIAAVVQYGIQQSCSMGNAEEQRELVACVLRHESPLSVLKVLRAAGCAWDGRRVLSSLCVDVVQFGLAHGCVIGDEAQQFALVSGALRRVYPHHSPLELIIVLRKAGCAWPPGIVSSTVMHYARQVPREYNFLSPLRYLLGEGGAQCGNAHTRFPLESFNDAVKMVELGKLGWPWTRRAAAELVACHIYESVPYGGSISAAVEQGAEVTADDTAAAAAAKGKGGTSVMRVLRSLAPPCLWDERSVSAANLVTWQFAADGGCPWTSQAACKDFAHRVTRVSSTNLRALFAAALHRHWLGARAGGCPCKGELHAAPILPVPPSSESRSEEVVEADNAEDVEAGAEVAPLSWAELLSAANAGTLAATPANVERVYAKGRDAVNMLLAHWGA